jgi:hypothetical protein
MIQRHKSSDGTLGGQRPPGVAESRDRGKRSVAAFRAGRVEGDRPLPGRGRHPAPPSDARASLLFRPEHSC